MLTNELLEDFITYLCECIKTSATAFLAATFLLSLVLRLYGLFC